MDGGFVLILLCLVMLVGSYVAGIIPLIVKLSEVIQCNSLTITSEFPNRSLVPRHRRS